MPETNNIYVTYVRQKVCPQELICPAYYRLEELSQAFHE